jgi:hypothetical protein
MFDFIGEIFDDIENGCGEIKDAWNEAGTLNKVLVVGSAGLVALIVMPKETVKLIGATILPIIANLIVTDIYNGAKSNANNTES